MCGSLMMCYLLDVFSDKLTILLQDSESIDMVDERTPSVHSRQPKKKPTYYERAMELVVYYLRIKPEGILVNLHSFANVCTLQIMFFSIKKYNNLNIFILAQIYFGDFHLPYFLI